jgi:hypothetical protein
MDDRAKMGSGAHHPLSRPRRERGRSGLDGGDEARFTNLFELADAHLAHLLQALALRLRGRGQAGGQRDGSLATGDARVELGQKRATIVRGPAA